VGGGVGRVRAPARRSATERAVVALPD
jgi:hypothetical protein